jgi:hypothetical protein
VLFSASEEAFSAAHMFDAAANAAAHNQDSLLAI